MVLEDTGTGPKYDGQKRLQENNTSQYNKLEKNSINTFKLSTWGKIKCCRNVFLPRGQTTQSRRGQ